MTSRKLIHLDPRKWIVRLVVEDVPASGENHLTKQEIIDSVIGRDPRAGVTIVQEFAVETWGNEKDGYK